MAVRNTRDQILREIGLRGDNPDEVVCEFFLGADINPDNARQEIVPNLPAGELQGVMCRSRNWIYDVQDWDDIRVSRNIDPN